MNSNVMDDNGTNVISWREGIYTPVTSFYAMFGNVIQEALDSNKDVRQAIRDADNGRGFADII